MAQTTVMDVVVDSQETPFLKPVIAVGLETTLVA